MIKVYAFRHFLLIAFILSLYGCRQGEDIAHQDQRNNKSNISLRIAAASDLQPWFGDYAEQWGNQQSPPVKIQTIYGNSSQLAKQIRTGAPYQLFLSADVSIAEDLAREKVVQASSIYVYALGQLAILYPKAIDLQSLSDLVPLAELERIIIANPQTAPYGRAAQAALRSARVWDRLDGRIVIADSVRQAVQQVLSGNAEAGIVALGHAREAVRTKSSLQMLPISGELHPPIRQGLGVIIQEGSSKELNEVTSRLIEWIKSDEVTSLFNAHGLIAGAEMSAKDTKDIR